MHVKSRRRVKMTYIRNKLSGAELKLLFRLSPTGYIGKG